MFLVRIMNDMKMKKKLAVTFISAAVLPLLLSGLFLTGKLREIVINDAFTQLSNNVERVRKRTEELIKVPLNISYRLTIDNRMKKVAAQKYESYTEVIQAYREYTDIRDYIQLYKEISSIRVYVVNPGALNNWEFIQPDNAIMAEGWYKEAIEQKGLAGWNLIKDERNGSEQLSLVRSFPVDSLGEKGVLAINVDKQQLRSILDQEPFTTLIVDDRNRVVGSNEGEFFGKNLSEIDGDAKILSRQEGSYDTVVNGKASKVVMVNLNPENSWNGLRIISIFSVSEITREANQVIRLGAVVITVSLMFAVLLIYASASLLSGRLLRLSKHMSKAGAGSWETYIHIDSKDEIGLLSKQFNALIRSVHDLVQEVQETNHQKNLVEQRQSEMKFKMLASQIHPHFLFNSLESIRMEAHIRRQDEIAEAVWLLSTLLRSSLEAGNGNIPLREELERVRCYLEMQKFRYEDRLEYHLTVDADLEVMPVPPLIIQPLVENSVLHGLDNREEGAVITVEVKKMPKGARVKVCDNGAGFTAERLAEIQAELAESVHEQESKRIGMRNVNDRLVLLYGESSALSIESGSGTGTAITFFIPGGALND
ncbi:cache domain-containing sensor histidine kinase [Paenibacillus riograndensis]|uniref:Histidine kinase n=2 Tax=Paenibacillus riograndensis TaxID=483937 RepID=A0A132TFZ6_9BACL|nr:sensor histidine kinase [Paenibacillus riograndensis]KWX70242.1 histidine kinase [Paenibacillus riograndensis]CQR54073.1 histidine kinase internal region [Paenibacillus riograndensis SBR5]